MADNFIDQDETQIYGPYASKKIRAKVVGLLAPFDPGLSYLADQIDVATAAVKAAIDAARDKDAALRKGVQQKTPVLKQAIQLLGRFSKHLDGHKAGVIDRKVFFTADGTAGGVGKGAQQVLLAVTHINGKLQAPGSPVRDAAAWHNDFAEMMTALAPIVEHADDARTDRRHLTPEVEAARQAWMNIYFSARDGVACVLRQRGKLSLMSTIFYDLAVPAGTRVTSAPDEPEPPTVDDEDKDEPEAAVKDGGPPAATTIA